MRLTLLIFFNLTFNMYGNCQNLKEAYLLPDNYKGKVVVVYNRPFGGKTDTINGTLYYKVPFDGVSVVTNQSKQKLEDCFFYQIDSAGKKNKLTVLSNEMIMSSPDSVRLKDQVGVFIFGTIGSCNPNEPESFCYSDFYVGSLNDMPKYFSPEKAKDFMATVESKAQWRRQ